MSVGDSPNVIYRVPGTKVVVRNDTRHPGRFRITWPDTTKATGTAERSGGRDLAAAKARAHELAATVGEPDQSASSIHSLVVSYLAVLGSRSEPTTVNHSRSVLSNHLCVQHGGASCSDFTVMDAAGALTTMTENGYARETRKDFAKACRAIGVFGVQVGAWSPERNPFAGLKVGRRQPGEIDSYGRVSSHEIPSRAQVIDLCETLEAQGSRWALCGWIIDELGLRWGEVAGLEAAAINLGTRTLRVYQAINRTGNGGSVVGSVKTPAAKRELPFSKRLGERLAVRIAETDGGLLFAGPKGGLPRANNVSVRDLQPARAVSSYPKNFAWHSIRHTTITRWIDTGKISVASRDAGHETPDFTMRRYYGLPVDVDAESRRMITGED